MARLSKGAQLRQQAAETPKYTESQLQQMLAKARREEFERIKKNYTRQWASQNKSDTIYDALMILTCVPCEVLVDDFGWAHCKNNKSKLTRFVNRVVERVNEVCEGDLHKYAEDMYDKLGVGFMDVESEAEDGK